MADDADVARELERLRAELMEFVLDGLAERMAGGAHPELTGAVAEAIDRRVDQAVTARVQGLHWPDPRDFADQVVAAAGGGLASGNGEARRSPSHGTGDRARSRGSGMGVAGLGPTATGFLAAIAIALVALAFWWLLIRSDGQTNTVTGPMAPDPRIELPNGAQVAPGNGAAVPLPGTTPPAQNSQR